MISSLKEVEVRALSDLNDPGTKEFQIGKGEWPFRGFVVRRGSKIYGYRNYCMHAGHPLNWYPNSFLTENKDGIICSSHGAIYELDTGLCIAGPCIGKSLHKLNVRINNGKIFVKGPSRVN